MDTAAPNAPAAEEALDQLLRQIITGFFVLTDGQGSLSKWSDPAELLFDVPAEEALGQPFFGRLVDQSDLGADAEQWRQFVETGEVPGSRGRLELSANRPGGGRFPMETVFVPVKLDEGFDFSLFLEDLSFELPVDMMLLRMRQQHPVVVTALRAALADEQQPWEGWRTAGTLIAFRPLCDTPWMDEAMARREAEQAAAEEELQSRIQAYEAPDVQGTDVYDLEDARAVIDRLRWATERIEDLEERSRIMESAAAQAADAQLRAEAAERAALDAQAAMADRPDDGAGEAERLELLARLERVERAAEEAAAAAMEGRRAAELERSRAADELQAVRARVEEGAAAERTALAARLSALEGDRSAEELAARLDAEVEALRARVDEAAASADVREELARIKAAADEAAAVKVEVEALRLGIADASKLADEATSLRAALAEVQARVANDDVHAELGEVRAAIAELPARLDHLRERAEAAEQLRGDLDAVRERTEAVEALLRDSADTRTAVDELRARVDAAPADAALAGDDRRRIEEAHRQAEEARAAVESLRTQADELRAANAEAREEAGRLQARLNELAEGDGQARHDVDALRREQDEIRSWLEDARRERDEARQQVRDALRAAEEARAALEREAREAPARAVEALSESETSAFLEHARSQISALHEQADAARARLDELAHEASEAARRADEARGEAAAVRGETAELREEARDAQRAAREVADRLDLVDRGAANVLDEVKVSRTIVEEVAALARSAQQDASESRAEVGEARAAVARLEQLVAQTAADAAGASELASGVGDIAHAVASEVVSGVTAEIERLQAEVAELRDRPAPEPPDVEAPLAELRAAIDDLAQRPLPELPELPEFDALTARIEALETAPPVVPDGLEARLDSLRDSVAGAMGRVEALATEFAASKTESGVTRTNVEQRLADTAADLMAARTDAEQARRGIDGLRDELTALREYAAAARAEASAAKDAAAKAGSSDARALEELRAEVRDALKAMTGMRRGFDEARQAAVAARRDADAARAAAEKVGAANEATSEKFTDMWKHMLAASPPRGRSGESGVRQAPARVSAPKKEAPPERAARAGFDDDARPMAVLDLKGKFKELNPAFSKLVGYREHEFGKATWPSVLDRSTYKEQTEELAALIAGDQQFVEVNSTYMHGQGLMVLVKGEIRLQRGEDGEPESLLLTAEGGA